jgi:hypothetical protein
MRKPLSRPFEDERPRLEVGLIANKKDVFVYRKTYTFLCGSKISISYSGQSPNLVNTKKKLDSKLMSVLNQRQLIFH